MSLEAIFSNPCLFNVAREILLMLDVDSLAKAELVCKSWRSSIVDNRVWQCKLKGLAKKVSFTEKIIEDKVAKATAKGELMKVCRSMCWNLQHGEKWLDENAGANMTRRSVRGRDVCNIAETESGDILYTVSRRPTLLRLVGAEASKKRVQCFESEQEVVMCIDVHKDYVALGSFRGTLSICNWKEGARLRNTAMNNPVCHVRFGSSGNTLAAQDQCAAISIWSFSDGKISLAQKLVTAAGRFLSSLTFDFSGDHVVSCHFQSVDIYRFREDSGAEIVAKHKVARPTRLLVVLRSAPGTAVTVHAGDGSLKVWDLDGGALRHQVEHLEEPYFLKECPETGLLAMQTADYVTLYPTAAVASGEEFRGIRIDLPCSPPCHLEALTVSRSAVHVLVLGEKKGRRDLIAISNGLATAAGLALEKESVAVASGEKMTRFN